MNKQFETYCCGQPMRAFGLVDCLNPCVDSVRRWVCEVCGHGIDLIHFDMDELELQNELELYGDAASPTHTHQLKGGDLNMADEIRELKERIEKLESRMDFLLRRLGISLKEAPDWKASSKIIELVKMGDKKGAIKAFMEESGASLKDAKTFIESIQA